MKDIATVIKNLLGGADAKTVRKVGAVVVDAMSAVHGTKYVLIPAADARTLKGSVKKSKRWAKFLDPIDYTAKPNGFALKGEWANVWKLSSETPGKHVLVSMPGFGMIVGHCSSSAVFTDPFESGHEFNIEGLHHSKVFEEGAYEAVIAWAKEEGVPAFVEDEAA